VAFQKVVVHVVVLIFLASFVLLQHSASAEDTILNEEAELAQELLNPVADLYTIPIQMDFDQNIGPADEGKRFQINIQPVIPFTLNEDWNLITRTILPVVFQEDIFPGAGSQSGIGDLNLSLFLSPQAPTDKGIIWGVGGVFLMPTASDELLGTEKWSAGPTFVALAQQGSWIYGALTGHAWSYAGDSDRDDINITQIYPWLGYTWPTATSLFIQSDMSYDWKNEEWSIPVDVGISQLFEVGPIYVSAELGAGYWAEAPEYGAEGWRFRIQFNFVLPKGILQ
jgi:hypothetical protein